jgi:hypothetical protein
VFPAAPSVTEEVMRAPSSMRMASAAQSSTSMSFTRVATSA